MIRSVNLKKSSTFVAIGSVCSLWCGLLVSGCSGGATESQRMAIRRVPQPSAVSPEASSDANRMLSIPVSPASAFEVRVAQKLIRDHLHAFGRNDFRQAYSLLTPQYQQNTGNAETLRALITSTYRDFMHVKKISWYAFGKDMRSGDIRALLTFEASGGGITRATYILHPQDGRYLISAVGSNSSYGLGGAPSAPPSRQEQMEEKMFSGVSYSPMPQHRVLDSNSISF